MSTLYQEPVRAHLDTVVSSRNAVGVKTVPILFAGITDKNEAIVIFGDGVMGTANLSSVSVDWRYDDKADRWRMLEDVEVDDPEG